MVEEVNRKDPCNLEAERSALGCAYISNYALEKICDELNVDMFCDKKNQAIFNAMVELHKRNEQVDATILKNEIEKETPINTVGGIEYLSEVIDSVVSASNVDSYINIIREKELIRKLIRACEKI